MTEEGVKQAVTSIEEQGAVKDKVLVVFLPDVHESIAGIIAGRIREKYSRPVFILTRAENCVKGSGRSIESYSMFDKMNECKDLLLKFGGHPMAAGLSLKKENIDAFRSYLNEHCDLSEEDLKETVAIDVKLPLAYLSESFISQLDVLEPFGNKNEKPSFADKEVPVKKITYIGKETKYLKFTFESGNRSIDGLYFGDASELEIKIKESFGEAEFEKALAGKSTEMKLSILYYPQINEFRGNRNIQIVVKDVLL